MVQQGREGQVALKTQNKDSIKKKSFDLDDSIG